ncbi:MAG: YafY family transcriptional regulator [Chloroflexi bacterium]|nr:YafY family transcriptional regulator [Chloroflexota bacterium]MBV9898457.1 YafY family transcriptional regulator [Chloroflexota bacterium]
MLQTRRAWTGLELAQRLEVTTRTVRNDVDRLRQLGYPVEAVTGPAGGYRLGAGATMPPLLLDDDEAVAVAIGLRSAATYSISGIEELALSALRKLEQVLPPRLRPHVTAVESSTTWFAPTAPTVDPEVLSALARACHQQERLRFEYTDYRGAASLRLVEPYRLVCFGRRWYLVAWDLHRAAWRLFRADRVVPHPPTGVRFKARELPHPDLARYVARTVGSATWAFRARVTVHASAEMVRSRLPFDVGSIDAVDDGTCVFECGSDNPHRLAVYLGMLDLDFEVDQPPELVRELRALSDRYARACQGPAEPQQSD